MNMALSNKRFVKLFSHGRKTDKETQSPVLKIFKEIMKRENNDPEKTNLLKEMQEDRKKLHSTTRSKSDNKYRDSSSSDRQRKNVHVPFKTNVEQRNVDHPQCREAKSVPFRSEKKESWWFWGDQPRGDEDTCSCVSCALKKICSSENMCILGYFIMFVVSVALALYLVLKNIPSMSNADATEKPCMILDSDRLKRKIEMLKDGMNHKYGDDYAKSKDSFDERRVWDDSISKSLDGLSGLSDFGSSSLRELNSIDDRLSSDLSSVIFNEKLTEDGNSDRLRNFYKKLIQTDEQIRNLKKGYANNNINTNTEYDYKLSDRVKRSLIANSLKNYPFAKIKKEIVDNSVDKEPNGLATKFHILYPPLHLLDIYSTVTQKDLDLSRRFRRYDNYTKNPSGIVIEEKQLILKYNPDIEGNKKVPKCSHTPKESKSHENQLKHPFYKNSQRLDELLDQFINKNVPQIPYDSIKTDDLFQYSKSSCRHPKINKNLEVAKDDTNSVQIQHNSDKNNGKKDEFFNKKDVDADEETTDSFGVIMSISTLLNPDKISVTLPSKKKDPRLRKLMQLDEKDDENHGYDDFNEVIGDDSGTHDENNKESDRIKRTGETFPTSNQLPHNLNGHNPLGVYNPNWKGPMPLYPDELNSMIKQAALNFNKIPITLNKDGLPETVEGGNELSDMEYVEDYLSSKNDRLVKMAQAYSDYGVLEGKKETIGEDTTRVHKALEKRVKLSVDKRRNFKGGLLGRWKKDNPTQHEQMQPATEGIRFELRPTSGTREDNPKDVFEMLRKHVKISHNHKEDKPKIYSPSTSDMDLYASMKLHVNDEIQKYITSTTSEDSKYMFTFPKGKRSLQSIDLVDDDETKNKDDADVESDDDKVPLNIDDTDQLKNSVTIGIERNDSLVLVKRELNQSENIDDGTIKNSDDRFIKKNIATKSSTNVSKDITAVAKNNSKVIENNSNMVFSDFFALLAKWFSALDGVDLDANKQKSNFSSTKRKIRKINKKKNKSSEIMYPMYDLDMIDNIGHRSRVLMSIEDKPNATFVQNNEIVDLYSNRKMSTDIVDIKTDKNTGFPFNSSSTITIKGLTKTTTHGDTIITKIDKKLDKTKNKTIVKRNADDSNLIFWNDIYDDEYGVQLDPSENTFREKDSILNNNNLMQNSKLWLQTKIKRFKNNMHRSTQKVLTNKPAKKRPGRSVDGPGTEMHEKDTNLKHNTNVYKRDPSYNLDDDDLDADKGTNFSELTENMKKVCRKAARAVQKARNIEVREDTKDESVATSLMQQLVHLMTDLVDYQVQQKTCVKLPADLSSFLVWLTSPNPNQQETDPFKSHHVHDAVDILSTNSNDGLPEPIMPSSEKEENHPESRSECLGTLQAVQELMHQFDAMSDEDKSKMTGVREYLLSQMEYLNQQLYYGPDESHVYQKRHFPLRYKRLANTDHKNKKRRQRRAKRKLHKFVKNFSKKHTRSTSSYYETIQESEFKSERKNGVDNYNGKPKRNLKDVYYKAVLDAKKATIKTVQRKDGKKIKDE